MKGQKLVKWAQEISDRTEPVRTTSDDFEKVKRTVEKVLKENLGRFLGDIEYEGDSHEVSERCFIVELIADVQLFPGIHSEVRFKKNIYPTRTLLPQIKDVIATAYAVNEAYRYVPVRSIVGGEPVENAEKKWLAERNKNIQAGLEKILEGGW